MNTTNYTDYLNNAISFRSVNGGGTSFSARTNTSGLIQFTVPNYTAGVYNIYVDSDLQGNSNTVQFTLLATPVSTPPLITSISPISGPAGTLVTVNVSNYLDDPNNSLTFHTPLTALYQEGVVFSGKATNGRITFTAPDSTYRTYEIQVKNNVNGLSNKINFELTPPTSSSLPVITSISPTSGPAGTLLTMNVLNLVDLNSNLYQIGFYCSGNGNGAQFNFTSVNGKIVFTIPGYLPSKCYVNLRRVNTGSTSNMVDFQLTAPL